MLRIRQSTCVEVLKASISGSHYARLGQQASRIGFSCIAAIGRYVRRAICVALILSLLAASTPAAPQTIVALARESSVSLAFWFYASGWRKAAARLVQAKIRNSTIQEKQQDRDARVSYIQISPGNVTVEMSDHVRFAAVAYDANNTPIGGVKIKWSGQDSVLGRRARISPQGEFEATSAGSFNIVAEGAGKTAAVTIVVRAGPKRNQTLVPQYTRRVSTRDLPSVEAVANKTSAELVAQQSKLDRSKTGVGERLVRAHTYRTKSSSIVSSAATRTTLLPNEGWGDSNYWSADDPGNDVGDPPGGPVDQGAGSGNFQFAAPVVALPGRGIDTSLGLAYNSRLWNKAGNQISFDLDRGWPAPGFSLGFGKLLGMGVMNGGMLVDADGTRHSYSGDLNVYNWGTTFLGHTTDGSFIDYWYVSGAGGAIVNAYAKLPNGTVISYGAPGPGAVYPTRIQDPNGNYINITYVNNSGPRIQNIVDTLARPINFHYDANNLLTAITGPGLNNSARTLVRLHYRQLSLDYSFSGLTPGVRESNPWVIDAIYYPGTNTGFWFGDSDSYSTYGMLAKVSERRNMTLSASSPNEQGTITSIGDITNEELYSYPLTTSDPGGSGLTDAPTYSSVTESWTRDGVNTDQAVTIYSSQPNANPRTMTITLPNGTKSVQYSHNSPGNFLDGLVFQDKTLDSGDHQLQSSSVSWEQGAYGSPRPTRVEATNERLEVTATEFSYGSVYNQVTEVRNYDYGGTALLYATRTQYQNSAMYTGRHIFNLPLVVEVFDGDGVTRVAKTDYQYDGQTLRPRPDVVQHELSFNPHASDEGHCYWETDWSDPDCNPPCHPELMGCDGFCPQVYYCPYDPATDYRGNVTQVISYADALNLGGPITETRRYDITGNLVTASSSCCEQTSFNYTVDTQYAYPLSQTRGSATDAYAQVMTSAAYDFNTGLVLSATDANGRISQTSYFSETLRPQTASLPSGAHTDYVYDDIAMSVTESTYLEFHPTHTTLADQSIKFLNGRGQVRQEKALGANGVWDIVDEEYDSMGRASRESRPYRSGTPRWTKVTYDALSRTKKIIAPDYTLPDASDGSTTETFYNEVNRPGVASTSPGETMRVVDAWGRERWGRTDAQGRLVEVVEPNPLGSGSVFEAGATLTTYSYNTLGNLTTVTQDAQTRSFKYDSLGRLIAQKSAEANATLDDMGTYQAGGGTWSDVFTYDGRSNLTSRTDARGVKTVYNYNNDPLNRLQSVSWDTSGFGDSANPILSAAVVSYQYRSKSSGTHLLDISQINSVTTAGISTENYAYNAEGLVSATTLILTSRAGYPFVTDYIYDELDRVTDVRYPTAYGNGWQPRKLIHHSFDVASRLSGLTVDGALHASKIVYNASSQTTSLSIGTSGPNQVIESYGYDPQTGLLATQTASRFSAPQTPILDLSYDYAGTNGKRTGQLTKILNNLNHNKDRSYSYDALARLVQAKGGPASAPLWTQTYTYDRFGNRTSVSANGYSAKGESPAMLPETNAKRAPADTEPGAITTGSLVDPRVVLPTDQLVSKSDVKRSDILPNNASLPHSGYNSHHSSRTARTNSVTPQSGPPVFTDDPLVPGVTIIKALHITELRTAVNQARSRADLAAANWAEIVATGVLIKAAHIVELRSRLDEARAALGLSPAPYTDPSLGVGTPVKAAHVQELRQRATETLATNFTIPIDGHANLSYDPATNRITTSGFDYDKAGNQVRALAPSGGSQRFQYDAANRLVKIKADDNQTVLVSNTYGSTNERLISDELSVRTYYACDGSAEYVEGGGSTTPLWSKTYIYMGARLLSTLTPNGSGGEAIQYHHPDRLGTRLVTNAQNTSYFEQVTLPFGTSLNAESTGATNLRFTTYDRSAATGLDYAVNRHYDAQQGRFTQVDPIGMGSVNLESPQTLNLYAYCTNDPINHTDPSGLGFFSFFGKLFKAIGKFVKILAVVLVVVVVVALVIAYAAPAGSTAISFAKFLLFKLAPVLAKILGGLTGFQTGSITMGPGGSPPWNPGARSVFGNGWQDQGPIFTCQRPPDCQNEIPPLPAEVVIVAIPRPPWHERGIFKHIGDWAVGFADDLTFGFTRWYDARRGIGRDDNSAYRAGGWSSFAVGLLLPGPGKLKVLGAADNIALKGFSKHGIDQAITRGVKPQAILDAARNPLITGPVRFDSLGRPAYKIVGRQATLVVNPATGRIVTVYRTSRRTVRKLTR